MGKAAGETRWRGRACALAALAMVAAACGPAPEAAPDPAAAPIAPPRPPLEFDIAQLDLDRPCTLLSVRDAERITGRPFFDVVANNRVENQGVRCGFAVGEGGVSGLVQVELQYETSTMSAEALYGAQCRPVAGAPPVIVSPACVTGDGGYAARLGPYVLVTHARRTPGGFDQALSLRLMNLIAHRVQAVVAK